MRLGLFGHFHRFYVGKQPKYQPLLPRKWFEVKNSEVQSQSGSRLLRKLLLFFLRV